MQTENHIPDYIPWRDRAGLTVRETAAVLSRSETWVRDRLAARCFEEIALPPGPTVIATASIVSFLERQQVSPDDEAAALLQHYRSKAKSRGSRPPSLSRPPLRLIVDNT